MRYYEHAYETHAYLPIYFAVTLSMYTLIPTVYRALLKSAVSGTDHRIHTTKKSTLLCMSLCDHACLSHSDLEHLQAKYLAVGNNRALQMKCQLLTVTELSLEHLGCSAHAESLQQRL